MQNDEIEKQNKVIKKLGEKTQVNSGYLDWPRHSRHETGLKKIRLPKERPSEKDQS